jgi:hypothetical protein
MSKEELMAEMRSAAASLTMAAAAIERGDYVAAEISVEEALFRTQSLMGRVQQAQQSQQPSASAGYHIGVPKPDTRDRG